MVLGDDRWPGLRIGLGEERPLVNKHVTTPIRGNGQTGFSKLLALGAVIALVSIGAATVYLWRRSKRHKLPDRIVEPLKNGTVESKSSAVETEPQLPVSYNNI